MHIYLSNTNIPKPHTLVSLYIVKQLRSIKLIFESKYHAPLKQTIYN